jgi:hypothetical protein
VAPEIDHDGPDMVAQSVKVADPLTVTGQHPVHHEQHRARVRRLPVFWSPDMVLHPKII